LSIGKIIVIVTAFVLLSFCQSVEPTSDTPGSEVLPTVVAQLRDEIQEMGPEEVYTAIVTPFGKETRNIGSGLSILQWDLKEGSFIFHPLRGPTYCPKTGGVIWLLRTKNLARPNVLQNYEMTTLPDTGNHGTQYWIGNIKINTRHDVLLCFKRLQPERAW
jgi:hypothetical protein